MGKPEHPHGVEMKYRLGCRCGICKEWKRQNTAEYVKRIDPADIKHGTTSGYRYGCRCENCKDAKRAENIASVSSRKGSNARNSMLWYKYGLTETDYQDMHDAQGGRCYICREGADETLAVDHCHTTGKVRDLLCRRCNTSLGALREDVEILTRMIAYIKRHTT